MIVPQAIGHCLSGMQMFSVRLAHALHGQRRGFPKHLICMPDMLFRKHLRDRSRS